MPLVISSSIYQHRVSLKRGDPHYRHIMYFAISMRITLFLGHPIYLKCQVMMQDAYCIITNAQYNSESSTPEHYLLLKHLYVFFYQVFCTLLGINVKENLESKIWRSHTLGL